MTTNAPAHLMAVLYCIVLPAPLARR